MLLLGERMEEDEEEGGGEVGKGGGDLEEEVEEDEEEAAGGGVGAGAVVFGVRETVCVKGVSDWCYFDSRQEEKRNRHTPIHFTFLSPALPLFLPPTSPRTCVQIHCIVAKERDEEPKEGRSDLRG